jgi:Cys-rich protein (TIGR01571 family)
MFPMYAHVFIYVLQLSSHDLDFEQRGRATAKSCFLLLLSSVAVRCISIIKPMLLLQMLTTYICRKWRHSLVTCGSGCSGCMYSLFCPMCAIATARTRFDGSHWCSNCFFLTSCMARNIIREGYDIDGHCCYDICWPCICLPCVANQLLAETLERGSVIDRWSKNPHR